MGSRGGPTDIHDGMETRSELPKSREQLVFVGDGKSQLETHANVADIHPSI